MIYACLSVFTMYSALVTAENEETFLDEFRKVALDALAQYEIYFGDIEQERKERIERELAALVPVPVGELLDLSYDLRVDGQGLCGIISVTQVYTRKEDVESYYQEFVDELNQDVSAEDEKWAVFDGGFFWSKQGYDIDELFK